MRLSATKAILERPDCVIVATVSAIYGIGDPSEYHSMILHLRERRHADAARRDQAADRDAVHAQRGRLQPRHVPRARRRARHLPGRARRERGARLAVRRRGRVAAAVRPADRPRPAEDRPLHRVPVLATTSPGGTRCSTRSRRSRSSCTQQKDFFVGQMKLIEAQRIEQRTRFDLEMMTEIGFCKGIENYSRHLSGRKAGEPPPTLIDYLPPQLADVRRREPRDDPAGRRHVQGRPRAQGEPRQLRLPAAVGARQPAAALRRVRDGCCRRRSSCRRRRPTTRTRTRGRWSSRWCGRPGLVDPVLEVRPAQTQVDDLLSEIRLRVERGERVLSRR